MTSSLIGLETAWLGSAQSPVSLLPAMPPERELVAPHGTPKLKQFVTVLRGKGSGTALFWSESAIG